MLVMMIGVYRRHSVWRGDASDEEADCIRAELVCSATGERAQLHQIRHVLQGAAVHLLR